MFPGNNCLGTLAAQLSGSCIRLHHRRVCSCGNKVIDACCGDLLLALKKVWGTVQSPRDSLCQSSHILCHSKLCLPECP